jgi:2-phospho-L-lactate guanylyltransferase
MGLHPEVAPVLALAMLEDTVVAARSARLTSENVVVSSDPLVITAMQRLEVKVVPGREGFGVGTLLASAKSAVDEATCCRATCIMMSDLPAATRQDIDQVLRGAGRGATAVGDLAGRRATMLTHGNGWPDLGLLDLTTMPTRTRARRHRLVSPGVQADVDTVAGLRIAEYLGMGAATAKALASPDFRRALGHSHAFAQ